MDYKIYTLREAQMIMVNLLKEIDRICKKNNISYWLDGGTLLGAKRHKGFIPWDDDLDIGMLREDYIKFIKVCEKDLDDKYFLQTPLTDKYVECPWVKVRDNKVIIETKDKGHQGVFIDIFPYDSLKDDDRKTKKRIRNLMMMKVYTKSRFKTPFFKKILKNICVVFLKIIGIVFNRINLNKLYVKTFTRYNSEINPIEGNKINYGAEVPWDLDIDKNYVFPLSKAEFEGYEFLVPNKTEEILEKLYGDWKQLPPIEQRIPSHSQKIYEKNKST